MLEPPVAAIIVPVLQQPDAWLEQSVESAVRQNVPVEVIVVHAANTPDSNRRVLSAIAREHENCRVVAEERPSFAASLNQGIRLATAARAGFLLADDWLAPTAVEKCLCSDRDIVCTGIGLISGKGADGPCVEKLIRERELHRLVSLEAKARYLEHFFLFRREKLFEVGLVDESVGDYAGVDDYHLVWTLLEAGASVGIVEEPLYFKREHDGIRLTTAAAEKHLASLSKILDAHGVSGRRKRRLMFEHSRWFSRPSDVVAREQAERPLRKAYEVWKRIVYGPLD